MALTIVKMDTVDDLRAPGGLALKRVRITFDNSYPTGGEAITPAEVDLTAILGLIPVNYNLKTWWVYHVAGNLVAVVLGTGAEVGNGVDLSTLVMDALVLGW